jgi:hypothetical protein
VYTAKENLIPTVFLTYKEEVLFGLVEYYLERSEEEALIPVAAHYHWNFVILA